MTTCWATQQEEDACQALLACRLYTLLRHCPTQDPPHAPAFNSDDSMQIRDNSPSSVSTGFHLFEVGIHGGTAVLMLFAVAAALLLYCLWAQWRKNARLRQSLQPRDPPPPYPLPQMLPPPANPYGRTLLWSPPAPTFANRCPPRHHVHACPTAPKDADECSDTGL